MAELTIDPASIRKAPRRLRVVVQAERHPHPGSGYVATAGDGIAHVTGLPGCMANAAGRSKTARSAWRSTLTPVRSAW